MGTGLTELLCVVRAINLWEWDKDKVYWRRGIDLHSWKRCYMTWFHQKLLLYIYIYKILKIKQLRGHSFTQNCWQLVWLKVLPVIWMSCVKSPCNAFLFTLSLILDLSLKIYPSTLFHSKSIYYFFILKIELK